MTHNATATADHARYTDEALRETIDTGRGAMHPRAARVLLEVLTDPADRAEAASRALSLMNQLRVRYSQAVSLAAHQVRDGAPKFVDEYHPNGPTA